MTIKKEIENFDELVQLVVQNHEIRRIIIESKKTPLDLKAMDLDYDPRLMEALFIAKDILKSKIYTNNVFNFFKIFATARCLIEKTTEL